MNFSFAIINLYSDGDTGADKVGSHEVERLLGRHCAPTFRGIKAGSLVAFSQTQMAAFDQFLAVSREGLARGGIVTARLLDAADRTLVLFYRPLALARRLRLPEARRILAKYGYPLTTSLEPQLKHLCERLHRGDSFPHEIGLFLGYPPRDVAGFIAHQGRGFLCCGCWKVYADAPAAMACFARYEACTSAFCHRLSQGVPLVELLRAV